MNAYVDTFINKWIDVVFVHLSRLKFSEQLTSVLVEPVNRTAGLLAIMSPIDPPPFTEYMHFLFTHQELFNGPKICWVYFCASRSCAVWAMLESCCLSHQSLYSIDQSNVLNPRIDLGDPGVSASSASYQSRLLDCLIHLVWVFFIGDIVYIKLYNSLALHCTMYYATLHN